MLRKRLCKRCNVELYLPSVLYCEECREIRTKELNEIEKQKRRIRSLKKYYLLRDNPEFKKKRREKFKIYQHEKYHKDNQYQIGIRLRNIFNQSMRAYTKYGKITSSRKYGINYKTIIEHLKPFPINISGYHIDHIKPLCSFDLNNPEEIKKAFSPENHQWLTIKENLIKGRKWNNISLNSEKNNI